jgi:protein ImuB
LLGAAQETIVPYRPPPQFSDERVLEYPAERREVIEQIVHELVQRVGWALGERREGVVQLRCRLDCAPGQPLFLEVGLFRPSADPEHLWDLVRMQLEQSSLPGSVGRVTLEATLTAPLENRQGELFGGSEQEAWRQFALFIDRCGSRLGPEAVLRPELTADPLPERAAKLMRSAERGARSGGRFKTQSRKSKAQSRTSHSTFRVPHSALERPLALLSPPLPLDVVSVVPDGPPVSFRFQGQMHHIARHCGPERIETGWWRGASVRRDYWRVETASGQRFWLFRRLPDGQWHLHGEYA